MSPELIEICVQIALKIGPVLYDQLADLLGGSIPTYTDLAVDNAELQAMIDAEK